MKKTLILISLLFLASINLFSTNYYVSTTGQNSNNGSIGNPWRTISYASQQLQAGDTLFIRGGVYFESGITPLNSGNTSDGYIVYSSFPGEIAIIDGTNYNVSSNGVRLFNKSYIILRNLEIRNFEDGNGIWVENSNNFEINDCEVHHCGFGIGIALNSHDFVLNRV